MEKNEIEINGKIYIEKSTIKTNNKTATTLKGKKYVIVRTYSAGVFAGYLDKRIGKEAIMLNARRIWYWEGANSLSQLAIDGTTKPDKCKFPEEVSKIELTEVIEILDVTEKARLNIKSVPIWKM